MRYVMHVSVVQPVAQFVVSYVSCAADGCITVGASFVARPDRPGKWYVLVLLLRIGLWLIPASRSAPPLPHLGHRYFVNNETGVAQWERPHNFEVIARQDPAFLEAAQAGEPRDGRVIYDAG